MAASQQDTQDPRALALAWLWSRPLSPEAGEGVDLETLDQWRQGLLSPARSDQVKRQLANDPRLMRMLEELVAADDLLQQWGAEEQAAKQESDAWTRLLRFAGDTLSRLFEPRWVGGLVAATAALLLVFILGPFLTEPDLNQKLEDVYAALDAPLEDLTPPWGPRIAMRDGPRTDPDAKLTESGRQAKRAFQAGMVEGMEQLRARYPALNLNPGDRLRGGLPECPVGDVACQRSVALARATGSWALAVYLQCRGSPSPDQPRAIDLLAELQTAWSGLPDGHPLGDQVNTIVADQNPCKTVERLLRAWGR